MPRILHAISPNESFGDVHLLHGSLRALGYTIDEFESGARLAGPQTLLQVRALQRNLGIEVDESMLVDEATAKAIGEMMKDQGLLEVDRSFMIAGKAVDSQGKIRKRQTLFAYDVDLRGAGSYRTITELAAMSESGFEFLGSTETDVAGNYTLKFYDWQYAQSERQKADVVVFAVDGESILGRSRLVDTEDYSAKGLVRDLNVVLETDSEGTEYERLMALVEPFLDESKVELTTVASSDDQQAFVASELDIERSQVEVAATASVLAASANRNQRLPHELLYGLGRQGITLKWTALLSKTEAQLREAIAMSVKTQRISEPDENALGDFISIIRSQTLSGLLEDDQENPDSLERMLSIALPRKKEQLSFLGALSSFEGSDYSKFWSEHLPSQPEFADDSKLISSLQFSQQLTVLSGNHQMLVSELQSSRGVGSVRELFELNDDGWRDAIAVAGIPDFVEGDDDESRITTYASQMQEMLSAAFPTLRIAQMVEDEKLGIRRSVVSKRINKFLKKHQDFDFSLSRIHQFDDDIKSIAGDEATEVRSELMKLQRIYQVSPSPEAMSALIDNGLHSARSIASTPKKSFIRKYAPLLGGELAAISTHDRASFISLRSEFTALHLREYTHGVTPTSALSPSGSSDAADYISSEIPNYSTLFDNPDFCECEHCRSLYGPIAYFVDLLRFLQLSSTNASGDSPLDVLLKRRPDLAHLPLTCENALTLIPYIDLANETMEHIAAESSIDAFRGHSTGDLDEDELRAHPQNTNLEAYRNLSQAVYPFDLPYHRPLDVLRSYSDTLGVSRHEVMTAVNPNPSAADERALDCEALGLTPEKYRILTKEEFDGSKDSTPTTSYFGSVAALEELTNARELLDRSGIDYTDLVTLVSTHFINPNQDLLAFLNALAAQSSLTAEPFYERLSKIHAGSLEAEADPELLDTLTTYNKELAKGVAELAPGEFDDWVKENYADVRRVITLWAEGSHCDIDATQLRTIQQLYEGGSAGSIPDETWSKLHRFIRLWRTQSWDLHELDLMLLALGAIDIDPEVIRGLSRAFELQQASGHPVNELSVLWGNIETGGRRPLYQRLFLRGVVSEIDVAFESDAFGSYFADSGEILANHASTIVAAFRISDEQLQSIYRVAKIFVDGSLVSLSEFDALNLPHLSTIYRHVVLAKMIGLSVDDLCTLIEIIELHFGISPFSVWDRALETYISIDPARTWEFYEMAKSVIAEGFSPQLLEYVLEGTQSADSDLELDQASVHRTARSVRAGFVAIDQDHPDQPEAQLTAESLSAKLSLTFQADVVAQLVAILDETATFDTLAGVIDNLAIPEQLTGKYSYAKSSGRLFCQGVMTGDERSALKAIDVVTPAFEAAVDELYAAPEAFLASNFSGVLSDLSEANAILLDHPAQSSTSELAARLAYVHDHFVPVLKARLREDAIVQHIASLLELTPESTAVLIADGGLGDLIGLLSSSGFSATYFEDADWTAPALQRTDELIDFSWGLETSSRPVPAEKFSALWRAHIAAPATGTYTLSLLVASDTDALRLSLDGVLLLELDGTTPTAGELTVDLNATQLHELALEYAHSSGAAGVSLFWKTAVTALEVVPPSVTYPSDHLEEFASLAEQLHRGGKLISTFELSEREVDHFITHAEDFDAIDFKRPNATHWQRLRDYVSLRHDIPQAQNSLIDVFAAASSANPVLTVEELLQSLHLATAWDQPGLATFAQEHFGMGAADFRNEIAILPLRDLMKIIAKTGLSATTVIQWGTTESDFEELDAGAQAIVKGVRAKYSEDDWLELAATRSDKIRENQQSALVNYLLQFESIQDAGVYDADSLFEHLLIDVQMSACMDTSRIVQASAAIQLFVNRVLLNLENDSSKGADRVVSPLAIDRDQWEWMQYYRVWEVSRKVFLYPENLLNPEWRKDRSEFFRSLESYLVQNDITERSVEQAYREYLTSLVEVANLEVCGSHQEFEGDDEDRYTLHVFGRTHSAPYKYFYRTRSPFGVWSAWKSVTVDIRSVEDGDVSGVHLIPVVWKGRLFLFWPEFARGAMQSATPSTSTTSVEKAATDSKISEMEAEGYWDIRLAWSEYNDESWGTKQLSKEFARLSTIDGETNWAPSDLCFVPFVATDSNELSIRIRSNQAPSRSLAEFVLTDPQAPIRINTLWSFMVGTIPAGLMDAGLDSVGVFDLGASPNLYVAGLAAYDGAEANRFEIGIEPRPEDPSPTYAFYFSGRKVNGAPLSLGSAVFLKGSTAHRLLPPNEANPDLDIDAEKPFFFSHRQRTYFVQPIDVRTIERLRAPERNMPYLPNVVDSEEAGASGFMFEIDATSGDIQKAIAPRSSTSKSVAPSNDSTSLSRSRPFAGLGRGTLEDLSVGWKTTLEFHTFHQPFSSEFVTRLNELGMDGLLASDNDIESDAGVAFKEEYAPDEDLVPVPEDFSEISKTYYKENICFDSLGANSIYSWELFFHAPVYIGVRLSENGKYEEAMQWFHHVFDPTTDESESTGTDRFWKFAPFRSVEKQTIEEWFRDLANDDLATSKAEEMASVVAAWRDSPFDPHLIASGRPLAYMKYVVFKYVQNLIAWADSKFRNYTRENVYEALQLYVIAKHILGPKPEFVPSRGVTAEQTWESINGSLDDFSNALVELENLFPYSSSVPTGASGTGATLLGVGQTFYFCIPNNEEMLDYWNTVDDRLFKIRHCQDISGVERSLALFAPAISPSDLVGAASQGLSIGSILADLSSPAPIYRFNYLVGKAIEFCADVRGFGSTLLGILEKKDAEELSRLRATQETTMLELLTSVRERRILEARSNRESLLKGRETAIHRFEHYLSLLDAEFSVPAVSALDSNLSSDSSLPADTQIDLQVTELDVTPETADDSSVKLIAKEKEDLEKTKAALDWQQAASISEAVSGVLRAIPEIEVAGKPLGIGVGTEGGGFMLGGIASAIASTARIASASKSFKATLASKIATYIRREQDWTLQANLAAMEIKQLDKQIASADIQVQVAEKELEQHAQGIEHSKQISLFLGEKFTKQELYQWMKEQLFAVYKQAYNLAFEMAKKAEKAYQYDLGIEGSNFIQYGYWDSAMEGLLAGDKLHLAMRQLEKSYIEENRRELELTKSVSVALLNPLALIELRETGSCYITLPEELFDLDFLGHYFRRIRSVRLTIPCLAGPQTTIGCSLRLLRNTIRVKTAMGSNGYEHNSDEGAWLDDDRFRQRNVPITSIATSSARGDSGVFELNFRDERLLPFEGAGVISDWQIELTKEDEFRQFDYTTISDLILEISYTAREDTGSFKSEAAAHLSEFMTNAAQRSKQPLMQMISVKDELPTEWHRFLYPSEIDGDQVLSFVIGTERFPFLARKRNIIVEQIEILARCTQESDYVAVFTYADRDGDTISSDDTLVLRRDASDSLHGATIKPGDSLLEVIDMDISGEVTLKFRSIDAVSFNTLDATAPEISDLYNRPPLQILTCCFIA